MHFRAEPKAAASVSHIRYFRTSTSLSKSWVFPSPFCLCVLSSQRKLRCWLLVTDLLLDVVWFCLSVFAENEVITVKTPAFAESVSEGDVRWEKGEWPHLTRAAFKVPFLVLSVHFVKRYNCTAKTTLLHMRFTEVYLRQTEGFKKEVVKFGFLLKCTINNNRPRNQINPLFQAASFM